MSAPSVRVFVEHPLGEGQSVPLTRDQAHYLFGVMRLKEGAEIALFNGRDGEWAATVEAAGKRGGVLACSQKTAPMQRPPDLWLVFAPIKKARTDFIVEKATELGAARLLPVQTAFTNSERIRRDRLQAHAVEAAEQCGATYVPQVADLEKLGKLLDAWPAERQILFCDEALSGDALSDLSGAKAGPWAIFIGPEGGFSPAERDRISALKNTHAISLGPRILRADTAAVAALTLWQSALGDWK
ncbi:MAG: 16S rRNA (uracil(1498)-N(3))-methyltransferase [Alphaproteobacteria bacterium]|nr:16S rRNA (uracil(1498)-N(3))-methyltransferase [Alphaproteobacteria bacterium]NNF23835.1 16S rRNA (uracil(1498)-N(3))-methyltransferase [Paracoccaceae bacterium]